MIYPFHPVVLGGIRNFLRLGFSFISHFGPSIGQKTLFGFVNFMVETPTVLNKFITPTQNGCLMVQLP